MDSLAAARSLLSCWRNGQRLAALPEVLRPSTRQEAYDIAGAIGTLKTSPVAGWKIAATSEAGQKHINVDGPLGARIFADRLVPAGGALSLGNNIMMVAECEFAFTISRDLAPRETPYTRTDVLDAVDGLLLSIEVPDSRYDDFTKAGAFQLIADTACASWLVVSKPVAFDWRSLDLREHVVSGYSNGAKVSEGPGKAALGDPVNALVWMANEAARYCGGLQAGQFVTTGTCLKPFAIAPGDRIAADYGVLGRLTAEIAA